MAYESGPDGIDIRYIPVEECESEHSLEIQLGFLYKLYKEANREDDLKIVPLYVGDIDEDKYHDYAKVLLPLFDDERTIFIISSDFCHWGEQYNFTPVNIDKKKQKPWFIYRSVKALDYLAFGLIQGHMFEEFTRYLNVTKTSICGKSAIQLFLAIIESKENN